MQREFVYEVVELLRVIFENLWRIEQMVEELEVAKVFWLNPWRVNRKHLLGPHEKHKIRYHWEASFIWSTLILAPS